MRRFPICLSSILVTALLFIPVSAGSLWHCRPFSSSTLPRAVHSPQAETTSADPLFAIPAVPNEDRYPSILAFSSGSTLTPSLNLLPMLKVCIDYFYLSVKPCTFPYWIASYFFHTLSSVCQYLSQSWCTHHWYLRLEKNLIFFSLVLPKQNVLFPINTADMAI